MSPRLRRIGLSIIAALSLCPVLRAQDNSLALGAAYDYNATLGSAFQLKTEGAWQATPWLALGAGARFSVREAAPWADVAGLPGWKFCPDTQYLDLAGTFQVPVRGALGLRLLRSGFPDTTAMYLAAIPYASLDLRVFYARLGLSIRDFFDPVLPPENNASWEYQLLVRLGCRIFLDGDRFCLRLEIHDGSAFDQANLQSLNLDLGLNVPLGPDWGLEPLVTVGSSGGATGAAAFHRFKAEVVLRRVWP